MKSDIRNRVPRPIFRLLPMLLLSLLGCKQSPPPSTPERYTAAKALFDRAAKEFHNPSAEKAGAERNQLLSQASQSYEQLLKDYPEQTNWCAQALRSLAGVRTAQGRTNDAVKLFAQVAQRYPAQDWEVIQAWKAAGDLLHDAGRVEEARQYYRQIVERFDKPEASQVVQMVVRGAKKKL